MNQQLILQPVVALMLLTLVVWLYMYAKRIPYIVGHKIPGKLIATPELLNARLPQELSYSSNNLKNLFELPVIFYVLCVLLILTQKVDSVFLYTAWVFVALRALHSLIQCTRNVVEHRFAAYLLSSLMLWFMLLRFALAMF